LINYSKTIQESQKPQEKRLKSKEKSKKIKVKFFFFEKLQMRKNVVWMWWKGFTGGSGFWSATIFKSRKMGLGRWEIDNFIFNEESSYMYCTHPLPVKGKKIIQQREYHRT